MSRRGAIFEGIGLPPALDIRPAIGGGLEKEELQLQRERLNQQKQAQKHGDLSNTYKWIDENFDPNKNLSGNPYADATYNKAMAELNAKAYQLAPNADIATIKMMLGPDADRLHTYSTKAKSVNENLDKRLSLIPNDSGYNKAELKKRSLQKAMLDEKGGIKNDIDETGDYLGQVLSENPLEVTTGEGLQNFAKESMINAKPTIVETKTYNNKGGYEKKKLKITAPDWMVLDTDAKGNNTRDLVPKYDIATDEGEPIYHTFYGKGGEAIEAPIRLADKKLYDMVLRSSPSYADNLRGRVIQAIGGAGGVDENGEPVSLNSPQAQNIARAFVYDDLKALSRGGVEDIVETKPTQIKNVTNVRVAGNKSDVPVMDIVTPVKQYFENVGEQKEGLKGVAQLNLFNNEVTTPIINEVKNRYPDITAEDIYYKKDGNNIWVMKAEQSGVVNKSKDVPVFKLDDFSNVTGNKPQGVKSKNEALRQAQSGTKSTPETQSKKTISLSTLKGLIGKKGYEGYTEKELVDYYKANGYEVK